MVPPTPTSVALRKMSAVLLIRLPSSCSLNDSKRTFGGDAQAGDIAMRNPARSVAKLRNLRMWLILAGFNGNRATLHELPERDAAAKYVEFMGGADAVLERREVFRCRRLSLGRTGREPCRVRGPVQQGTAVSLLSSGT
jgi:hypothetical protein